MSPKKKKTPEQKAAAKARRRAARQAKAQQKTVATTPVLRKLEHLQKQVNVVKKRTDGPKVELSRSITMDLGMISPAAKDDLTKQLSLFLNPLYMKTPDSEKTATPLTMDACKYQLWKLASLDLKMEPLVGSSAVAGTVVLATIVKDAGETGDVNVNNIYTRQHHQCRVGSSNIWKIPSARLRGPLDGWFYTNPDKEQTTCLGPLIEFWTYGRTMATYRSEPWTGPLFRVRATATFQFSSFDMRLELSTMEKTKPAEITMDAKTDSEGNGVVTIKNEAGNSVGPLAGNTNDTSAKDIIWAVSDAVVSVLGEIPGWGWLIKGGWWFLKKIVGKDYRAWLLQNPALYGNADIDVYHVFTSYDNARTDEPWKPPVTAQSATWSSVASFIQLTPSAQAVSVSYPLPSGTPMAAADFKNKKVCLSFSTEENTSFISTAETSVANFPAGTLATAVTNWVKPVFVPLIIQNPGSAPGYWASGSILVAGIESQGSKAVVLGDIGSFYQRLKSGLVSGIQDPGVKIANIDLAIQASGTVAVRCAILSGGMQVATPRSATNYSSFPRVALIVGTGVASPNIQAIPWRVTPQDYWMFVVLENQEVGGTKRWDATTVRNEFQGGTGFSIVKGICFDTPVASGEPTSTVDGPNLLLDDGDEEDDRYDALSPRVMRAHEKELQESWGFWDSAGPKMSTCCMCTHHMEHTLEICLFMRFRDSNVQVTAKTRPFRQLMDRWNVSLDEKPFWTFDLMKCFFPEVTSAESDTTDF